MEINAKSLTDFQVLCNKYNSNIYQMISECPLFFRVHENKTGLLQKQPKIYMEDHGAFNIGYDQVWVCPPKGRSLDVVVFENPFGSKSGWSIEEANKERIVFGTKQGRVMYFAAYYSFKKPGTADFDIAQMIERNWKRRLDKEIERR